MTIHVLHSANVSEFTEVPAIDSVDTLLVWTPSTFELVFKDPFMRVFIEFMNELAIPPEDPADD